MKTMPNSAAIAGLLKGLLAGLLTVAVASAEAQTPPETPARRVLLNGFASLGYTHNLNTPATGANGLRLFDDADDTFGLDVAELVAQLPVAKPGEAGFRMDLTVGEAIPEKTTAAGLRLAEWADLQQAYLSYMVPVSSGVRVDLGKFVTHMGAELIEGYDGYNDHYSRSFLFNYAIPFTHTGLRATYALRPAVTASLLVVNGWDNVRDSNHGKSVGAQLAITPRSGVTLTANYIGGREQPGDTSGLRQVFDGIVSWQVLPSLVVAGNYDYGVEGRASLRAPGEGAHWSGLAGYLKYDVAPRVSLAVRAERLADRDGARLVQSDRVVVRELTVTPTIRLTGNLLFRAEARFDRATRPVFVRGDEIPSARQATVGANAVFVF